MMQKETYTKAFGALSDAEFPKSVDDEEDGEVVARSLACIWQNLVEPVFSTWRLKEDRV